MDEDIRHRVKEGGLPRPDHHRVSSPVLVIVLSSNVRVTLDEDEGSGEWRKWF